MGEVSKTSGELGEDYVHDFLNLIGWTTSQENETIKCHESDKHNTTKAIKGKQTHGIDELFIYESPMDIGTMIHSVISVKHTIKEYPPVPNGKFKEFFNDLAYTIECYENSDLIDLQRENQSLDNEEIIGVLFWLSSPSDDNHSIISKVNTSILKDDLLYKRIHIIDNDRISFLRKSIDLVEEKFKGFEREFYYIDTPNNLDDSNKKYSGKILPVEMLSSDIQIFRLQKDKQIIVALVSKDKYCKDSLKRILGLAHRISNNLTSNIQIFFPSLNHKMYKSEITSVKSIFKDKLFINTTEVYGYDIGYRGSKTISNDLSEKVPNEDLEIEKIDNGKMLPYGENLRSLISNSLITSSELKNLLRLKGIYVCNPNKENTIPILSSLILSPKEFDSLREHQKTKEDNEKRATTKLKIEKKITSKEIKSILKTIDMNEVAKEKFSNYDFDMPKINSKIDEVKEQLTYDYKIKRYERNKSWDEQTNYFTGTVIFDYSKKDLEIISESIFTSKETQNINQKIINHCKEKLIETDIMSENVIEEKILMKEMSNEENLQFLLSFTDNKRLKDIEFIDINSIDIEIDNEITLPMDNKLKWMESKINKLKLDGKKIDDTEIITDINNHKYLKCLGIICDYKFENKIAKGSASIKLEFNTSYNGQFVINIQKLKFNKKLYKKKNIDEMIFTNINEIKHTKHKEIRDQRI